MGEVREGLGEMASQADLGQAPAAIGLFRAAPGEADLAGELSRLGSTKLLRLESAGSRARRPGPGRAQASAGSGRRLYRPMASLPVSLETSSRVHGPVLRSKSRPKPTHFPAIRCPVGSSSSWMAPW